MQIQLFCITSRFKEKIDFLKISNCPDPFCSSYFLFSLKEKFTRCLYTLASLITSVWEMLVERSPDEKVDAGWIANYVVN